MSRIEYFKFYVDDFLASPWVMGAPLAMQGAYVRMLALQWKSPGCQIPNNIRNIKIFVGGGIKEDQIKAILQDKFMLWTATGRPVENLWEPCGEPTFWRNERLYVEFRKALLDNSKKSFAANSRWSREKDNLLNKLDTVHAPAMQENVQTTSRNDAIQNHIQNHSPIKEKMTKEDIAQEKATAAWDTLLAETKAHLQSGNRIVISDKRTREVITRIGGSVRLREAIDTAAFQNDFFRFYIQFDLDAYKERKKNE